MFKLFKILLLLSPATLLSQTTISGEVRDSLANPLRGIAITLHQASDSTLLNYSFTDTNGHFQLHIESFGAFFLKASGIGLKAERLPFRITELDKPKPFFELIMQSETLELDEVVLNAELPILVRQDTVVIKVASFLQGNESVLEDVFKKLPGIQVSEDGSIRVAGKRVEKVLIEGDDLFNKGYKVLTRNMTADVVEQIQILNKYDENPLLKNIRNSDAVALNVTLKEGVKHTLFGKANLGAGWQEVYRTRTNLINVRKKTKLVLLGNMNNVGIDALGDINTTINPGMYASGGHFGDSERGISFLSRPIAQLPLKQRRVNFNKARLVHAAAVFNPSEQLKVRAQFRFNKDARNYQKSSLETFTASGLQFQNKEAIIQRFNQQGITAEITTTYLMGKTRLVWEKQLNLNNSESLKQLQFNTAEYREDGQENALRFNSHLNWTQKLGTTRALQLSLRAIRDSKPLNYSTNAIFFEDIYLQDSLPDVIQQLFENQLEFLGAELSYLHNSGRARWRYYVNLSRRNAYFSNRYTSLSQSGPANSDLGNQVSNELLKFETGFRYSRDLSKTMQLKGRVSLGAQRNDFVVDEKIKTSLLNVEPLLGLIWKPNPLHEVLFTYQFGLGQTNLQDQFPNYFQTGYRTLLRGVGAFVPLRSHQYLLNYIYGNWGESFLINTSLLYNKDLNYLGNASRISAQNMRITKEVFSGGEMLSINFNYDQHLKALRSNLKLKFSVTRQFYQDRINDQLRNIHTASFQFGPELRTLFSKNFNLHIGNRWSLNHFRTSTVSRNRSSQTFLDLNWNHFNSWVIQFTNEWYRFPEFPDSKTIYISDFSLQYSHQKTDTRFGMTLNNIWNTDNFSSRTISDTGNFSQQNLLYPRYLLFSADFRF